MPTNTSTPASHVDEILATLSLDEKIELIHGSFLSGGIPRLGIPQLELADGPVGIRLPSFGTEPKSEANEEVEETSPREGQPDRATALPATLLLASTWNRKTAYEYSALLAREMRASNKHVLLAPGINMMRDPRGGRNYEYFGDDPYLTAEFGIAYVKGLQDNGIGANLKHYVANECDQSRHFTSSNVSESVLREVYAYPFEKAIKEADAWTMMTGNNLCNGTHMSENIPLLKELLRDELEYEGVVLTDWRSAYDATPSAQATLDMTTGFCQYVYGTGMKKAIETGDVSMEQLDSMVVRILKLYQHVGLLDPEKQVADVIDAGAHAKIAREIAAEGMVLLKNTFQLLPIPAPKKLLLTGPGALAAQFGTGSGLVNNGEGNCSPLEGLVARFGEGTVEYNECLKEKSLEDVDLIIYFANAPRGGEGFDLDTISLSDEQVADINAIGSRTDKLLVVLQTGTTTDTTTWDDATDALLVAWYGGESAGHAIADIISGDVSPSAKLPCNFGNALSDYPCSIQGTWPARLIVDERPGKAGLTPEERKKLCAFAADYTEGFLIGHRWFERQGIQPRYPFGFGLTYSTTQLDNLEVLSSGKEWVVECIVTNTGMHDIREVVQLYIEKPSSTNPDRPIQQLANFEKVRLQSGESRKICIAVGAQDLAIFEEDTGWLCEAGDYVLKVGTSSQELPLSASINLLGSVLL